MICEKYPTCPVEQSARAESATRMRMEELMRWADVVVDPEEIQRVSGIIHAVQPVFDVARDQVSQWQGELCDQCPYNT